MNQFVDTPFTIADCVDAFSNGFKEALDIELVPYKLNETQQQYVEHLMKNKYDTDEWNYKK